MTSNKRLQGIGVVPSEAHLAYHACEVMGIVHWGLNTYTDQEWGFGNADPGLVKPDALDPEQWVCAMKAGGIGRIVMVCKHHDGFCLWPSPRNVEYSTAVFPEPYKGFDVVRAVERACRKYGVAFGAYLSPWDRHHADYGRAEYVEYFHGQWDELMEAYGPLCEIWLDGANGGTGWYGGVNGAEGESRSISAGYYEMGRLMERLAAKYPLAVVFNGFGERSIQWCGNERGVSAETWWNPALGDDGREHWLPSEADVPLRTGWFFHAHESPKSLKALTEMYFHSVGHGATLNLGIAPDRHGRVCEEDVARLKEFGDYVRAFNAVDFAAGRGEFLEELDETGGELTVLLPFPATFNCVDLRERIELGQRIERFSVEVRERGYWREVATGTTIGVRRLVRFEEVTADAVQVTLVARARPEMHPVALRFAPVVEDSGEPRYETHFKQSWVVLEDPMGLAVDCGMPLMMAGFDYTPRAEGCTHEIVDAYAFEVSEDAQTWRVVATGEFGNMAANPVRTRVVFEQSVMARYVRFTARHVLPGSGDAGHCLRELDLFDRG